MRINTGKGYISLVALVAIWSVSAVSSLPGLAISPILGDLSTIFPRTSELEVQMLTSLPSLLIIPFVLIAGFMSVGRDNHRLLRAGLVIFFLAGGACLLAQNIKALIIASCILGIGAGMIIPLSTGLVVRYFTGDYRVRQLGYSSAISNLTLVVATAATGYLAGINWHLPFLVYLLPGISLILIYALRNTPPAPEPKESDQMQHTTIHKGRLAGLTTLYFLITYGVLAISYYLSYLTEQLHIKPALSGVMISIFFLAIMLPGFALGKTIRLLRSMTNIAALVFIVAGLFITGLGKSAAELIVGVTLAGLGYGVMQPIIYDKAAISAPPHMATKALSIVMTANYLAVMICPFIVELLRKLFHEHGDKFPFLVNGAIMLVLLLWSMFRYNGFVLGLDKSYYNSQM